MNIVLLYGNGLDQSFGLKTSYANFLNWMIENRKRNYTPAAFEFIDIVREHVSAGDGLWKDFEIALGLCQYGRMSSCEGFEAFGYASNIVFAVQELMRSFLIERFQKFRERVIIDNAREMFYQGLERLCQNEIGIDLKDVDMSIVTLNYTKTLETILRNDAVFHPHGTLDPSDSLIFGVDSNRQLKNLNCGEFARLLCKRSQIDENTIRGETRDEQLIRMINNADVMILFGLSFGPTDYRIWKAVSRRSFTYGAKIVLCPYNGDEDLRFKQGMCQWGLNDDDVDKDQMLLLPKVSEQIITAKDSQGDFFELKNINELLNRSSGDQ